MATPNKNNAGERGKLRTITEILKSAMPHKLALHIKIAEINERWADVAGSALAGRSHPVMFEYEADGSEVYLLVHASSPAAAQRVKMLGGKITTKLKDFWQIEIIGVRVRVI